MFFRPTFESLVRLSQVAALSCAPATCLVAADLSAGSNSPAMSSVELGDASLTSGLPGTGQVSNQELDVWLADPANHSPIDFSLPKGLDAAKSNVYIPEDNPITRAKIELGRQLYFDNRLSVDSTVSCASCHAPAQGYGATTRFGVGVSGQEGGRNSPVSYNRLFSKEQFWDGRAASLEAQAVGPIANPIEMGNTHGACVKCLAGISGYKKQFDVIFEDGVTIDNIGKALATFERVLVTGPTPYDFENDLRSFKKVFAADIEDLDALKQDDPELFQQFESMKDAVTKKPMSESALNGMTLFAGKANCAVCHAGANFTDEQYHNLGVGMEVAKPDLGRFEISKKESERGAFKTPTLRSVALSPPFMHDGSQKTLEEVIQWYNIGGHKNPWLSDKMKPLQLTDQEKKDLLAFIVEGLTGDFPIVEAGRLPK